jgi:hypothetical protein
MASNNAAVELLDAQTRADLHTAQTLLAQVPGFLYLPIFAPDEATATKVANYLMPEQQPQPFVVSWPQLERTREQAGLQAAPDEAQWLAAQKALLEYLDYAIAHQAAGGIVLLNTLGGDRPALAARLAQYLNTRREALRQRGQRLVLLWPSDAAARQHLMEAAPDLWSIRAADPVLKVSQSSPHATDILQNEKYSLQQEAKDLPAAIQNQISRWQSAGSFAQAKLSYADALEVLRYLAQQKSWALVSEFAEQMVMVQPESLPQEKISDAERAQAWIFLSGGKGNTGDRLAALNAAKRANQILEQLAQEDFAAHAPDLASNLNNLSVDLAEAGERAQGLVAIRRAVDIRGKLAQDNFAAHAPALASSLNNLSNRLAEAGERAQGLAASERACELIAPFAVSGSTYSDWQTIMTRGRDALRAELGKAG